MTLTICGKLSKSMLTNKMNKLIPDYHPKMKHSLPYFEKKDVKSDRKSLKRKKKGRELFSEMWFKFIRPVRNQPENKKYRGS